MKWGISAGLMGKIEYSPRSEDLVVPRSEDLVEIR